MIAIPQTLRVVYDQHYSQVGASRSTLANHRALLNRWERLTSNPDVREITHRSFEDYRAASIGAGLRPDSIESGVRFVRTVLNLAVRVGLREAMPWGGKRLRGRQEPKRVPSLADLGSLYEHVEAATWPRGLDRERFWKAFLVVALWTSARLGDLLRIRWDGITEDAVSFVAGKTLKSHILPRHPVIDRHLKLVENWDVVRVLPVGKSNKQLLRAFHEMSRAAETHPITPQAIRRLGVTCWQRARWGCGEIVQGSALQNSARYYVDVPPILRDAASAFRFPDQMLLPCELDSQRAAEAQLLESYRRLSQDGKNAVNALAEKLAS